MPRAKPAKSVDSGNSAAGARLILAGTVQFILVMAIAQFAYPCTNSCYSILTNPISDLGNTATSPLWPIFNYSLIIFGMAVFAGALLFLDKFSRGWIGSIGTFLICMSALGAAGVGVVPENTILALHSIFALIAFISGAIGIILIGTTFYPTKAFRTFGLLSIILGIVSLAATAVILLASYGVIQPLAISGGGIGFGAVERIVAAPILLWLMVAGVMHKRF